MELLRKSPADHGSEKPLLPAHPATWSVETFYPVAVRSIAMETAQLIRLSLREEHSPQHARRACRLDEDTAVKLVGGSAGHEHEATGARPDAVGVQVGQPDGADGGSVRWGRNVGEQQGEEDGRPLVFSFSLPFVRFQC